MGKTVLETTKQLCEALITLLRDPRQPPAKRLHPVARNQLRRDIEKYLYRSPKRADINLSISKNDLLPKYSKDATLTYDTPFGICVELEDVELIKLVLNLPDQKPQELIAKQKHSPFTTWLKNLRKYANQPEKRQNTDALLKLGIDYLAKHKIDIFSPPSVRDDKIDPLTETIFMGFLSYETSINPSLSYTIYILSAYQQVEYRIPYDLVGTVIGRLDKTGATRTILTPHLNGNTPPDCVAPQTQNRFDVQVIFNNISKHKLIDVAYEWQGVSLSPYEDVFGFLKYHLSLLASPTQSLYDDSELPKLLNFFRKFNGSYALILVNIDLFDADLKTRDADAVVLPGIPNIEAKSAIELLDAIFDLIVNQHMTALFSLPAEAISNDILVIIKNLKDFARLTFQLLEDKPAYLEKALSAKTVFSLCKKLQYNYALKQDKKSLAAHYHEKIINFGHDLLPQLDKVKNSILVIQFLTFCGQHLAQYYLTTKRWKALTQLWNITIQSLARIEYEGSPFLSVGFFEGYLRLIELQLERNRLPEAMALAECYFEYEAFMTLRLPSALNDYKKQTLEKVSKRVLCHYSELHNELEQYATSQVHINENGYFIEFVFDQDKLKPKHFTSSDQIDITIQDDQIKIGNILSLEPTKLRSTLCEWALQSSQIAVTTHSVTALTAKLSEVTLDVDKDEGCASGVSKSTEIPVADPPPQPSTYTPHLTARRKSKAKAQKSVVAFRNPIQEVDDLNGLENAKILQLVREKIPPGYGELTMITFTNNYMPDMRNFYVIKQIETKDGLTSAVEVQDRAYDESLKLHIVKSIPPYGKNQSGIKILGDTIRIKNLHDPSRPAGTLHATIPLDNTGTQAKLFVVDGLSNHKRLQRGAKPAAL